VQTSISERLAALSAEGELAQSLAEALLWSTKVASFLRTAMGSAEASAFLELKDGELWTQHAMRVGHVQGLVARNEAETQGFPQSDGSDAPGVTSPAKFRQAPDSRKVFVVHGHDASAMEGTARFLEKLRLQPIILHEQPNSGRTIIEKFETYSDDIAFAVILLTADDFGGSVEDPATPRPRARQNVILELGYFLGRLGRSRVCALYKGDVELPSDIQGILYIPLDPGGAWKTRLAQEFVQAKVPIELSGLVGG
jgi:predicted nucleotide-binding protein